MPRQHSLQRAQRRQTIRVIDDRIQRRELRYPSQGQVMRIRATSVDLRIRGSAKLWKNVSVKGGVSSLSVGDLVPIGFWRRRPQVVL